MTTNTDSSRLAEIQERWRAESQQNVEFVDSKETYNVAYLDIRWLLERDKKHREQLAALVPAADAFIKASSLEPAMVLDGGTEITLTEYETAKSALAELEGK